MYRILEKGENLKGKASQTSVFTNRLGLVNAGLTWVWAGLAATCLTGSQEMALPGLLVWEPHWG